MAQPAEDAWRLHFESLDGIEDLTAFVHSEAGDFLNASDRSDPAPQALPARDGLGWVADAVPGVRPVRELGRGGMGVVFEILDERTGRREALKILFPHLRERHFVRRFEREAVALGRLRHPSIATLYSAGVCQGAMHGAPWLRMEFIDGRTILDAFDTWMCDPLTRARVTADIADAIGAAHEQGVLHLDLTPGNILVTSAMIPKVLDFGVAHLLDEHPAGETLTLLTHPFGTLAAMAPEQFDGRAGGVCSDVYALGVLLYRALTGRHPIDIEGLPFTRAADAVRAETPRRPRDIRADIPRDLETIALTALEKSPKDRYSDAWAMRDDLRRVLAGRPIVARPVGPAGRCLRLARRHRREAAAVGVAGLLLVGATVVAATQAIHATRAQADAESRLAELRALATSLVFDFNDRVERVPGTVEARAEILRALLPTLEALEREADRDPALASEVVRAYTRLGEAIGHIEASTLGLPDAAGPLSHACALGERAIERFGPRPELARATSMATHRAYHWTAIGLDSAQARAMLQRARDLLDHATLAEPGRIDDRVERLAIDITELHLLRNRDREPGRALDGLTQTYRAAEALIPEIADRDRAIDLVIRAALPVGIMARESGRQAEGLAILHDGITLVQRLRTDETLRPVHAVRAALLRADYLLTLAETGAPFADRLHELRDTIRACRTLDDASPRDDAVRRTTMVAHIYAASAVLASLRADAGSAELLSAAPEAIGWCDWALTRLRERIDAGVAGAPDRETYAGRILAMRGALVDLSARAR